MTKVKVLDKNLKIVRPGMRCCFRDLVIRKRNGEQVRMLVQGDTAIVESVAPGEVLLKADRPILKPTDGKSLSVASPAIETEEVDQAFTMKTKYVERFKAWVIKSNKDGVESFLELLE